MLVIGCDPGLSGALALINETGLLELVNIPVEENHSKTGKVTRRVDVGTFSALLSIWSVKYGFLHEGVHACLEQAVPLPGMPSTTTASTFDSYGVLRAVLELKVDYFETVHPQMWKRDFGLKAGDKDAARECAMRLYPGAPLKLKKSHNMAEALLVAHWYWRRKA